MESTSANKLFDLLKKSAQALCGKTHDYVDNNDGQCSICGKAKD